MHARAQSAKLNVSGPAISRALNRLAEFDLVHQQIDPSDRRSALARCTMTGAAFLLDLKNILAGAGRRLTKCAVKYDVQV
jgi:DNA-binding MarR family transcriptional regulator